MNSNVWNSGDWCKRFLKKLIHIISAISFSKVNLCFVDFFYSISSGILVNLPTEVRTFETYYLNFYVSKSVHLRGKQVFNHCTD